LRGVTRGTTAILLIDFLVTIVVTTAGVLYIRAGPTYLLLLSAVTFVLFFIILGLLSASNKYLASEKPSRSS
jgi:hypothetical protein